ncbi:MAG: 2-succinylbenzoate--CoA ligase [Acaryochloridaceae cyanobacterium RU_4_10]|nr:2-succinylbenzoate--CoA ligase [Acaryochloridaceae cyanobacterium RU_4_10]
MDSALEVFESARRSQLLGSKHCHWVERTQYYCDLLAPLAHPTRIILSHSDPVEFLAGFMAACIHECPVFLCNPIWSIQEWQQVMNLVQPHFVWGAVPVPVRDSTPATSNPPEKGWIMIPTGGSSGRIKFAIHTWATLTASVRGFQDFFKVVSINSCCVLPLYHVSGLMQFLRSLLTDGQFLVMPFTDLLSGQSTQEEWDVFLENDSIGPQNFFLSLVPTQLQRLLQQPTRTSWLRHFLTILLGGAPAWPALLEQARQNQLNLAPTYGMTETAAQVATLRPHEFLQGETSTGCLLPHVKIRIVDLAGKDLEANQAGQVMLQATSLFQGYYPDRSQSSAYMTDDLGYLDTRGYLYVVGRSSRKIISGGENIFPEEVEAALYATGLVQEVYVMGLKDDRWGEVVAAYYIPIHSRVTPLDLKESLDSRLSRFKHPKRWVAVRELPRNAQGKLDWVRLIEKG